MPIAWDYEMSFASGHFDVLRENDLFSRVDRGVDRTIQ
jgi:hypothetical protein